MRSSRVWFVLPVLVASCAVGTKPDWSDAEFPSAGSAGVEPTAGTDTAGTNSSGDPPVTAGTSGGGTPAMGGTAASAGKSSGGTTTGGTGSAGASTGGSAGSTTGGKANGGAGGSAGGGGKTSGGANTGGGSSGGTGGSVEVTTGSCSDAQPFKAGSTYALKALVTSVCNDGTPCTQAMPAGKKGTTYEFTCVDMFNCSREDPGSTNWGTPPWQLTKECTP